MLSTPVLDVAIGLSLFYLLLGLICTTLNEMIAGWRKSRANFLDKGIGRLLGDAELKRMVFNHPLSWLRGTYDDVRNRNGKNSRNVELTAAGFPVFNAIA